MIMFRQIGKLIEKRPLLVISIILIITIGFGILIPGIEFRTDFRDFMPEEEVVEAYWRIADTFGQTQLMMFLYLEKDNSESVISANAIREQLHLEKELKKLPEINQALSVITIIDQFCILEFGDTIYNCTDEQIQTVIQDILMEDVSTSIKVFDEDTDKHIVTT